GAFVAGLRGHPAVPVQLAVAAALVAAGAARRPAHAELAFENLAAGAGLGAGHHRARCQADRRAVEVLPDAAEPPFHVALRQAGVGAGGAGSNAEAAGLDAAAHRIRVSRSRGMGTQGSFDGGGHRELPRPRLVGVSEGNISRPDWFRGNSQLLGSTGTSRPRGRRAPPAAIAWSGRG